MTGEDPMFLISFHPKLRRLWGLLPLRLDFSSKIPEKLNPGL